MSDAERISGVELGKWYTEVTAARINLVKFGAMVRGVRQSRLDHMGRPLGLRWLAEYLDISHIKLHHLEHGRFVPDERLLQRLLRWMEHDPWPEGADGPPAGT